MRLPVGNFHNLFQGRTARTLEQVHHFGRLAALARARRLALSLRRRLSYLLGFIRFAGLLARAGRLLGGCCYLGRHWRRLLVALCLDRIRFHWLISLPRLARSSRFLAPIRGTS